MSLTFFGHVDRVLEKESSDIIALLGYGVNCGVPEQRIIVGETTVLALFVACFSCILLLWYVALMVLRLLVILIRSHLSGLKYICQSVSQSCSLLRSSYRDSASLSVLMKQSLRLSFVIRLAAVAIKNTVSSDFYPRSFIVKSVFDCCPSGVFMQTSPI